MTHHDATFLAFATDGEHPFGGVAENGDTSVHGGALSLAAIAHLIRTEVRASIDADRPLVVVISKNKPRATAGEKFLELFAVDIVRATLDTLPDSLVAYVAGSAVDIENLYFHPRVVSLPLDWARNTPLPVRMHSHLVALSTTDEGLEVIPKGRTHAGV